MANERIPNDPYDSNPADDAVRTSSDPFRARRAEEKLRNAARLDSELQVDPELAEGPAGGGRIAVFAVAIAVVLGAVFYGLNHSTTGPTGTSTAQNTQSSPPAAPPGMRDVTPRANNMAPGQTTGAAPAQPQTPPSAAPTGPDVNRAGKAPLNSGQSK